MATTLDFIKVDGVKVPLIHEEDDRLPIVSMQLIFRDSGSIEDGAHPGLAKLSARMMNEGSKSRGSIGFAKALDARAIQLSAHTGVETFVFEMGALKEEFAEGVTLLRELVSEPNLNKESLQKVKAVATGSLTRKENDYDYVADIALKSLLFEGTPLANPGAGTVESVEKIALSDVEAFIARHLVKQRAIIVIGGDISLDDAKAKVAEILEALPEGEEGELPHYGAAEEPKEKLLKRKTEQAYLYFGSPYHMKAGDEAYYKARVAAFILGAGGFGSRLMEEVRVKRGLAYSAYGRVSVSRSSSYFSGYLQTKIESQKEARQTVQEVIAEFVEKGVTKEELEQAKKFLLGSEPLRVETLSQRLSRTFMEFYKGEELGHSKKELEKIRALTLDDLNDFIKSHTEINRLSFAIVTE
jgi:zinc protease